ncbi:glutathione S-transferase [Viridothelium virens]|uniref:Glutathione S-transferase n=1 Tax=Viridothelium virens TaxID=1048519 RepID=A0A6A6HEY1_VIRVR|nr:glutathione S-transferase [Viridothelium virens]
MTSKWFNPPPPAFTSFITSDPASEFPAEPNRYVLYVHYGCPFAHRTNIVYHLKRLQSLVGFSAVSIHRDGDNGWGYDGSSGSDSADPIYGFKNLRQLYEKADPEYKGGYSVPFIFDRKKETIVSNDSSDIVRMLSTAFDSNLDPDLREENKAGGGLLPAPLKAEIEELNDWVNEDVSWGAYKCGFSQTQEHYDEAMTALYKALDKLEERLAETKFLFGDHITEADVRLFPTIARFDMAYVTVMNCDWKQIRYDYPNLHRWLRHLYWEVDNDAKDAFKGTTHFDIFMEGYAKSAMRLKLVPWGPKKPILPLSD